MNTLKPVDPQIPGTIIITGYDQHGKVVTEVVSSAVFGDPLYKELGYIARQKFASLGIDIDAELQKWTKKSRKKRT